MKPRSHGTRWRTISWRWITARKTWCSQRGMALYGTFCPTIWIRFSANETIRTWNSITWLISIPWTRAKARTVSPDMIRYSGNSFAVAPKNSPRLPVLSVRWCQRSTFWTCSTTNLWANGANVSTIRTENINIFFRSSKKGATISTPFRVRATLIVPIQSLTASTFWIRSIAPAHTATTRSRCISRITLRRILATWR